MNSTCRLVLTSLLITQVALIVAAESPSPEVQGKTLADIARETRAKKESGDSTLVVSSVSQQGGVAKEPEYRREIQALLERGAYAELEAAAESARKSKERLTGGVWKLYIFYDTVATPAAERPSSLQWTQHLAKLQNWAATSPQSVTPRVALAEAYRLSGWNARGGGSASTVSDAAAKQFEQQDNMAYKTLVEAGDLPNKCPHWYFVMLEVARDQGWNRAQTKALFERAIAFEPAYYHYYREYATNLLPKWNGEPGQAEAFAEDSYRRIGGRQGAFVYFEIATVLYCVCSDGQVKPTLSWATIKDGFAEIEELYGATTLKLNRFATLAYMYRDREVARSTLSRVAEQWDPAVWRNLDAFNSARTWAGLPTF